MKIRRDIKEANEQIHKLYFTRLVIFADIVNRYSAILINKDVSWLRTITLHILITRGGRLTPSQLARLLLRSSYSVTKLIRGLKKDGFVRILHNSNDRRSIYVKITEEGLKNVFRDLDNTMIAEAEIKSSLDDEELKTMGIILRKLRDQLIEKVPAKYKLSPEDNESILGE